MARKVGEIREEKNKEKSPPPPFFFVWLLFACFRKGTPTSQLPALGERQSWTAPDHYQELP